MSEDKWREISAEFYRFEKKGDTAEGILVNKGSIGVRGQEVGRYELETSDGRISFLGGVALDAMLAKIEEGTMIKLVYQGKVPTLGGTTVKQFKVYVAEGE